MGLSTGSLKANASQLQTGVHVSQVHEASVGITSHTLVGKFSYHIFFLLSHSYNLLCKTIYICERERGREKGKEIEMFYPLVLSSNDFNSQVNHAKTRRQEISCGLLFHGNGPSTWAFHCFSRHINTELAGYKLVP